MIDNGGVGYLILPFKNGFPFWFPAEEGQQKTH